MMLLDIFKITDYDCKFRIYQDEELVYTGQFSDCPVEYLTEIVSKICPQGINKMWIFLD